MMPNKLDCQLWNIHISNMVKMSIERSVAADLGSELPLPVGGHLRAEGGPRVCLGHCSGLTGVLGDEGLKGLLARQQGGLQFLPQQEEMFGFLHLSRRKHQSHLHCDRKTPQ